MKRLQRVNELFIFCYFMNSLQSLRFFVLSLHHINDRKVPPLFAFCYLLQQMQQLQQQYIKIVK